MAKGNESVWDWLWQRYLNTHNANQKVVKHEDTLGSAEASANQMVEQTR